MADSKKSREILIKELQVLRSRVKELQHAEAEHIGTAKALRVQNQRNDLILQAMMDGFWIMDMEGRIIQANPAICSILGYSREEMTGMRVHDIEAQETPEQTVRHMKAIGEKGPDRFETRQRCKDGQIVDIEVSTHVGDIDGDKFFFAFFREITRRKRMEWALEAQTKRNELVLQTAMDGFWVVSMDGRIIEANRAVCSILGYSSKELIGMNLRDIDANESPQQVAEHLKLIRERGADRFETRQRCKDGQILDIEIGTQLARIGQEEFFFSFCRDITRRKAAEAALDRLRERMVQTERLAWLGTAIATVSHQLNQPLTVIRLLLQDSLEELKETSCCDAFEENLTDSLSEVDNAMSIINQFLKFAHGRVKAQTVDVDLNEVISRTTILLANTAKRAKLRLLVEGVDNLPVITGDVRDIEQILFILIENAIQAADGKQWRRLIISAEAGDKQIQLRFSDDCSGIGAKNIDKIFEPFFTTKDLGDGTGLGLTILKQIISDYGGTVQVESRPKVGTDFYVTLPITRRVG